MKLLLAIEIILKFFDPQASGLEACYQKTTSGAPAICKPAQSSTEHSFTDADGLDYDTDYSFFYKGTSASGSPFVSQKHTFRTKKKTYLAPIIAEK